MKNLPMSSELVVRVWGFILPTRAPTVHQFHLLMVIPSASSLPFLPPLDSTVFHRILPLHALSAVSLSLGCIHMAKPS